MAKVKPHPAGEKFVTVHLDEGVYKWLAEMVEAKARSRQYQGIVQWYDDLVLRADEQFKAAAKSNGETPHKRVIQRVAKGKRRR